MTTATSRRDARKAKVREALLQAASALFRAHGYEATTMDQVAAAAQVSRRTVFRYFPTKDALVFPHAQARVDMFREALVAQPGELRSETVRRACLAVASEFATHRDELILQQELIASSPALQARERELDRGWEEALAASLLQGRRRPSVGGLRAAVRVWYAHGQLDATAVVDEVLGWLSGALEAM
jgi:AcrR family transcriptional regulator